MLDIDISFLKFLLDPNYEYIKNDVNVIQDKYLEDIALEERYKKIDNFNNVNYLFLTKIDDLNTFLTNFNSKIIEDIYIKFGNFFKINLEGKLTDNNFISNILLENNIKKVSEDFDLTIFRKNIYEYLLNIVKNSSNLKDKNIATNALKYMEELLNKKAKIDEFIIPKLNLTKEKLQKRKEIKDKIVRKIIREHSYLLSDAQRREVTENNLFNYSEILKNEELFKLFFDFDLDDKNNDYIVLKSKNTINDIEKLYEYIFEDDFVYISDKNTYKGQNVYIKLIQDINKYNILYKNSINDLKYTKTKEEILINIKGLILKEQADNIEYKINFLEDMLFNKDFCNCFDWFVNIIVLAPLTWIRFNKDNKNSDKLVCEFYYTLVHEMGHVYDLDKENLEHENNIFKRNSYKMLYEIYNEYRAINKTNELIFSNNFIKKGVIHQEGLTIYQIYFCFLIDFLHKYEKEFLDYIKTNDITVLENLIGKDKLEKLLVIIEEFDYKKFNEDIDYANKMFSLFNEYLEVKTNDGLCTVKKLVK